MKLKRFEYILIIFAIIGVLSILSYIMGFSICIFYNVTGVYCPSCGMTRAFISLMNFDIAKAFYYNPMFILVPLAILPFFIERFCPKFKLKKSTLNTYFLILIIIVFVAWFVRLYLYFPNPPLEYKENNLLSQLYNAIKNSLS